MDGGHPVFYILKAFNHGMAAYTIGSRDNLYIEFPLLYLLIVSIYDNCNILIGKLKNRYVVHVSGFSLSIIENVIYTIYLTKFCYNNDVKYAYVI